MTRHRLDAAVASAREAFGSWRHTTPADRSAMLLRAADLLDAHTNELAHLEVADTGKPRDVTRDEEIPASILEPTVVSGLRQDDELVQSDERPRSRRARSCRTAGSARRDTARTSGPTGLTTTPESSTSRTLGSAHVRRYVFDMRLVDLQRSGLPWAEWSISTGELLSVRR
jgi:hypothetical protein